VNSLHRGNKLIVAACITPSMMGHSGAEPTMYQPSARSRQPHAVQLAISFTSNGQHMIWAFTPSDSSSAATAEDCNLDQKPMAHDHQHTVSQAFFIISHACQAWATIARPAYPPGGYDNHSRTLNCAVDMNAMPPALRTTIQHPRICLGAASSRWGRGTPRQDLDAGSQVPRCWCHHCSAEDPPSLDCSALLLLLLLHGSGPSLNTP